MTTEEKFKAAVNVIRNLPPKGSVKPSYHVMLKFYAYFKQATEGPNKSPKPPFWDPVRKAKWDAWSKLGTMDSESAMKSYVDEFKKIVDSFSSANVENIDQSEIDLFYASVPVKDLELLVGPVITNSRPGSPSAELDKEVPDSLIDSSVKLPDTSPHIDNVNNQREMNGRSDSICTNGSIRSDDDEDDEYFLDTIESSDNESVKLRLGNDEKVHRTTSPYAYMNGHAKQVSDYTNNNKSRPNVDDRETSLHVSKAIINLQKDLEKVVRSVNVIEQRIGQLQGKIVERRSALPHFVTSPLVSFVLLFSWPLVLQLLIIWLRRRK